MSGHLLHHSLAPLAPVQRAVEANQAKRDLEPLRKQAEILRSQLAAQTDALTSLRGKSDEVVQQLDGLEKQKIAFDLCNEIYSCLADRQTPVGYGQGGFGQGGVGGAISTGEAYQKETMALFATKVQSRITAMHDAFAKEGLHDTEFDSEYLHPANNYSIKAIAAAIARLAKKL